MSSKDKTELYILKALLKLPDFCDKFIDKMHESYFSEDVGRIIKGIKRVYMACKTSPSTNQLIDTIIPKICKGDEELIEQSIDTLQQAEFSDLPTQSEGFYDWIVEETKTFIKRSRLEQGLVRCVELMEQSKLDEAVDVILKANDVVFDESLGIDYLDDVEKRMDYLRNPGVVIDTGINKLNHAIGGGWRPKSLNIFGAATNVGKTLILGDITCRLMNQGYNGLYLTLEINEHILSNRIDANLTNMKMTDIPFHVDELYERIVEKKKEREELHHKDPVNNKPFGRLIVKEYPPGTINANQILALVRDLELRKGKFKPDFLVVDYLGLMIPNGKAFSDNTYGKLKTVSEELRAVGCILNIPVFSAVQVNREGYNSSYISLNKTSDSMGIPQTADLMIMVSRDEESDMSNLMYWCVAKSRFSRNGEQFTLEVDYEHMKLIGDDENNEDEYTKNAVSLARDFKNKMTSQNKNNNNKGDIV
jgi:hypothetical protein